MPEQHGFVKGRSIITNLLLYNEFLSNALDSSLQVDSIYTDFSKAFDTVDGILFSKIWNFGIRGSLFRWITSYLSNRKQYVRLSNTISRVSAVPSGVPQGSHLGPLLFIIFINDLVSRFSFIKALIYADDLKLFAVVRSLQDVLNIQEDLNFLSVWSRTNGLRLNYSKCNVVSFVKCRSPIIFDYI